MGCIYFYRHPVTAIGLLLNRSYMVDRHQLLHRIHGKVCRTMTTKQYEEDTAQCTRCKSEVDPATLVAMADWELCEICVDDI